jgi:hypothetical protein
MIRSASYHPPPSHTHSSKPKFPTPRCLLYTQSNSCLLHTFRELRDYILITVLFLNLHVENTLRPHSCHVLRLRVVTVWKYAHYSREAERRFASSKKDVSDDKSDADPDAFVVSIDSEFMVDEVGDVVWGRK